MAHSWPAQSPEANHTVLASGSGSASTLAHAQELSAQAAQLRSLVSTSGTSAAGLYGTAWSGTGATSSQATHIGVNTEMAALASWLDARAPIVAGAAQAYQSAVTAMVPTHEAQSNRSQEAQAVEINPRVLGALTPQITELNLDYFGHMWPTNASVGTSYGAALNSATAALATPPPVATKGASPEAPAAAAEAMTDAQGRTAAGAAMRGTHQSVQATSLTQHGSGMSRAMVPPPTPPSVASPPPTKFAELRPPAPAAPRVPPPMGMYQAPPSNAAVYGPPAPAAGAPAGIRPGVAAPPAGVTSFVRPSAPFAMLAIASPPTMSPGILNASTVYAAAAAAPISDVAAQPLQPLQPLEPPPPPIHSLHPPPAPAVPAQPNLSQPPPEPPPSPPRSDQGAVQMLGHGPPPPQAPPAPAPPPPPPDQPPLRPAPIPPWAVPAPSESQQHALDQYKDVVKKIRAHNSRWPDRTNSADVALYNSEANYLNNWKAQLEGQLEGWNAEYTQEAITPRIDDVTSGWTQPAPETTGSDPTDPSTPTGQRGGPMHVPRGTNAPETIGEMHFSGHALDEMQSDGIPVSVVNNALRTGMTTPSRGGTTIFYDPDNNVSVVQASDGTIVTVSFGDLR